MTILSVPMKFNIVNLRSLEQGKDPSTDSLLTYLITPILFRSCLHNSLMLLKSLRIGTGSLNITPVYKNGIQSIPSSYINQHLKPHVVAI